MSKEEMREGFEAWHCEQYKTKHTTGAPTRDMHNGVRAEDYGSKKQQALWECWQETGGDAAKVEALKDEIERIEEGKQPVAWFRSDALGCAVWKPGATLAMKDGDPLYTRSDAGEVEQLREAYVAAGEREHALREELATAKRNEHNSEVAYKAAIEKQEELRAELGECKGEYDRAVNKVDALREALSAARNDLLAIAHLVPGDYIQKSVSSAEAAIASAQTTKCKTCNGTQIVDDGEMHCSSGGIPFENGPIKCVKDCPDCAEPTAIAYRLLAAGDTIAATDEYLEDDAATWSPVRPGIFNGMKYIRGAMVPVRRAITSAEQSNKECAQ